MNPGVVKIPGVMIAPGQQLPPAHMIISILVQGNVVPGQLPCP